MPTPEYDVCVIGSGAAGGSLSMRLAQKGARVALVEGGPYRDPVKLGTHRLPWQRHPFVPRVEEQPAVRADASKEPYEVVGDDIYITRARVFGGRTTHWNAVSLRFSERDFREWSTNGIEEDWPLTYQEIAPYYDQAEKLMVICGTKEGLEDLPDGQFIPALPLRCSEMILRRASRKFGMRLIPVRKALATEPGHGRLNCHYCGHCMQGCGVSAIYNTAEHAIPKGQETGRLDTYTGWMAHELIASEDAKIRAARLVATYGSDQQELRARAFAVCCGNIESPRLLLMSKSPRFPNGLANEHDNVGRYLHGHATAQTMGYLTDLVGAKPFNQDGAIDHAYIPRFAPYRKVDYVGGFGFQINVRSYQTPHHAPLVPGFGTGLKNRIRDLHPAHSVLLGYGKVIAQRRNRVTLHPTKRDRNGLPIPVVDFRWHENDLAMHRDMFRTAREIYYEAGVDMLFTKNDRPSGFASHEVGACRMGKDPKTSVLNAHNQAHDIKNLFVIDGSSFTTFPEKNPTLTIVALALRAADRIFDLRNRNEI